MDVALPSLNRATKCSQPQLPMSCPRLGTQFLPTSLAPSVRFLGSPYLHGVPMGKVSFIWELCSGLAGYPCVLLLPWGQEGGPGKAQSHWALSECDLPQCSLFPVMGILGVPLVWVPALGIGASTWTLGDGGRQTVPLQAPTTPSHHSPPQAGVCAINSCPEAGKTLSHQASTVHLPTSTAALTGDTFSARVLVPVCTREENVLPLGNELQSGGGP